jgi:hypothetical protein
MAFTLSQAGMVMHWRKNPSSALIGIHRYRHGGAVLISDEIGDLNPKYSLFGIRSTHGDHQAFNHVVRRI